MKISVSLPTEDIDFLDEIAKTQGYESRSAVVHSAVRLLRSSKLGEAYADAWSEWDSGPDGDVWDRVADDGVT